jgi:hypothetical protein
VIHNGEVFCLLGLDKARSRYSDFGGSFDHVYAKHKNDSYKNEILGKHQIKNGRISDDIIVDHYLTHSSTSGIANQLSHKLSYDVSHDKSHKLSLANGNNSLSYKHNTLGYGDPNTQYTAFREFIEETAYLNVDGTIGYVFDPDTVFNKFYKHNAYMYLGGDREYAYDMFVLFYEVTDLLPEVKKWFLKTYDIYKSNSNQYLMNHAGKIKKINMFSIKNNHEMMGIVMMPIDHINNATHGIQYSRYCEEKRKRKINAYQQDKRHQNEPGFHTINYGVRLLDNMRHCFADALIKYSNEFTFLENVRYHKHLFAIFDHHD